jgi:hypothetical protein
VTRRSPAVILLCALAASCGESGGRTTAPQPQAAPATSSWQPSPKAISAESADKTYVASWEPEAGSIPDAEPFNMRFAIRRSDGKPIAADVRFMVDAEMPHHGHGMNLVPTMTRAGQWNGQELVVASGMLLHMPGRWVLSLDTEEDGVLERTQWFIDVE